MMMMTRLLVLIEITMMMAMILLMTILSEAIIKSRRAPRGLT